MGINQQVSSIQADFKNPDDHCFLYDITAKLGVTATRKGAGICHQLHLVNWGLLPLVFADEKDYDTIDPGDRLSIDTTDLKEGVQSMVKNETKNRVFPVASPLCQADLDSVKAGGVINRVKQGIGSRQ